MTGGRRRLVRVLLSLDAGARAGEILEAGAGLASRLDAELEALLVEASDLLRAVSHPASLHVAYGGGSPPGLAEVEGALGAAVEHLRRELARAAEHEGLRWSLRLVGEEAAGEAAPFEGGVVVLERTAARLLAAGSASTAPARRPVLLPGPPPPPRREPLARRVWVLWDGSEAAREALDVAARLAAAGADAPALLVAAEDLRQAERLAAEAPLPPRRGTSRWRWAGGARPGDVVRALPKDAVLVAGARSPAAGGPPGIERMLRDAPGTVLIVG